MKGTRELRRRFKGIGLIRVACGTHSLGLYRRMNERLTQLYEANRLDWLRALRDKLLSPREWFERTNVGDFAGLPSPAAAPFTEPRILAWLADYEASDAHRRDLKLSLLRLARRTGDAGILPDLLRKVRTEYQREGKATAFNRTKAHVQAYLRDTIGPRHPAYLDVASLRGLKATPKREHHPCTVLEALTIAVQLGEHVGAAWLTMCLTGAGPKELWVDGLAVDVASGHLRIAGRKRRGRNRLVPLVGDVATIIGRPTFPYRLFRERLSAVTQGVIEPYDARRTYAKWLALSGIPMPHQDAYLGHGPRTMTGLYQQGNEGPYLRRDGELLAAFIRTELANSAGKDAEPPDSRNDVTLSAPARNRTLNLLIKSPSRLASLTRMLAQDSTLPASPSSTDAQGSATTVPDFMPDLPEQ